MLRKTLAIGSLFGLCLSGTAAAVAAGRYFAEEPPSIAGAAFSAVVKTESVTTFSDGNRVVRGNTVHFSRDGQGRTRTERGEQPNTLIAISDPVAGLRYLLNPRNKVAAVFKLRGGAAPVPAAQDELDVSEPFALLGFGMGMGAHPRTEASSSTTSLGEKVINGVTASGTRVVRTIPSEVLGNEKPITSTLDRWVSPELGIPIQITQTSSIGGRMTLSLEQVARTEPDPALFAPPSDYTRRQLDTPASAAVATPPKAPDAR